MVRWVSGAPLLYLGVLPKFHGRLATDDGAFSALGHDELGTALCAYVTFAGLISQLLDSMIGMLFRVPLGSLQL